MPALAVYLPAFNEADTIGALIDAIPASIPGITTLTTIVVDDGSTDGTGKSRGCTAAQHVDIPSEFEYAHESLLTWRRHGRRLVEVALPVRAQRPIGESRVAPSVAHYALRAAPVLIGAIRHDTLARRRR